MDTDILDYMQAHVRAGVCVCVHVLSRSIVSDSLWPHGLSPTRLLCLLDIPGKHTGVDFHFLLQGICSTQELNPCVLRFQHC